jgi:hypothetical protein
MEAVDVRARLVAALQADLVGPFLPDGHPEAGTEVLPMAPSRWYLTGFLAPRAGRALDPDDDDANDELPAGSESQAEDAGSSEPEAKRTQQFPASMGLSVFLPPRQGDDVDHVEVEVQWADYAKLGLAEDHEDKTKAGWKRVPRGPTWCRCPWMGPRSRARMGCVGRRAQGCACAES